MSLIVANGGFSDFIQLDFQFHSQTWPFLSGITFCSCVLTSSQSKMPTMQTQLSRQQLQLFILRTQAFEKCMRWFVPPFLFECAAQFFCPLSSAAGDPSRAKWFDSKASAGSSANRAREKGFCPGGAAKNIEIVCAPRCLTIFFAGFHCMTHSLQGAKSWMGWRRDFSHPWRVIPDYGI